MTLVYHLLKIGMRCGIVPLHSGSIAIGAKVAAYRDSWHIR
jgi:hypothetical protein